MGHPEQAFDLTLFEDGYVLRQQVEAQFRAPVTAIAKIGQGFYAHVYRVDLAKDLTTVIVKCHKYAGRSAREAVQLDALRRYALVTVPAVYAIFPASEGFPGEALCMAYISGINASKLTFPDERTRLRFADAVVENLLAWHAVTNPAGFGELEGAFLPTWLGAFGQRIARYHRRIQDEPHRAVVSQYVMGVIDRSFESMEAIFQHSSSRPSLVHSDYNAWNMMADPETYTLTGVIDPIDAGWSDPEIDLFHLPNARPDFGLLERYLREIEVDDFFWMRFKFYRFWDDVKHYLRMGWYQEERFRNYASALEAEMDALL